MDQQKTKYALVGTGGRATMFLDPIATTYKNNTEIVGLCDTNPTRLSYHKKRLEHDFNIKNVPVYNANNFDKMIKECKPDHVIVTTIDAFHHKYIIRAMELGCNVITEKPMTIDSEKCRAILQAIESTSKTLRVTFNYRWAPGPTKVKQLLQEGTIGDIIHVDMEYWLNTSHGADYFRRWHREKNKSGGLIVHKSTHHFDLVNWWINAVPESVFGMGKLAFYGQENAKNRGIETTYNRYTGHSYKKDPFALDLSKNEQLKALYLNAEKDDGYIRDRNVFDDGITIEDTMSLLVRYRTGVTLNYSLNAYLPREGYKVVFNGNKGLIEYTEAHNSHIIAGQSDKQLAKEMKWENKLILQKLFSSPEELEIPSSEGGHGGADPLIQEQIFDSNPRIETWGRNAGHGQGAASILIGSAGNLSFKNQQLINISEICPELGNAKHLDELY